MDELENGLELGQGILPFTLEDAEEAEKACVTCNHSNNCAIYMYVNKLSLKRDNKTIEADFNCSLFEATEEGM